MRTNLIQDHVSLRDISWFKTGGIAEYYARCTSSRELVEAVVFAQTRGIAYRVIGAGSNLLMSDAGFAGLVIQNAIESMVFLHDRSQVIVGSGVPLSQLIARSISAGYSGLEFLTGVPGTVGGAVYGNAAAFGMALGDYVRAATVLVSDDSAADSVALRQVGRDWFRFGYRSSVLKEQQLAGQGAPPVILSLTLQLSKMHTPTAMHRLAQYSQLRKDDPPSTQSSLQISDCLAYAQKSPVRPSIRRSTTEPPLCFIAPSQLPVVRKGSSITVALRNPNYIINQGIGTSQEAAQLVEQILSAAATSVARPAATFEYFGIWGDVRSFD